jgi:uncharacterized protein involved in outer membrane biogenesis
MGLFMARILVIIFSIVIIFTGGILFAPSLIDWNKYKAPLIEQIEKSTGYDVALDGDLDFRILPYPRMYANNLTLTVPDGKLPLLTLDHISVSVDLIPLLKKQIIVQAVELNKPVINLEINKDNKANWMTPNLEAAMADSNQQEKNPSTEELSLSIDKIKIVDGSFQLKDVSKNSSISLAEINVAMSAESLAGPYTLSGAALYNKQLVKLDIISGKLDKDANTAPINVSLSMPDKSTSASFAGIVEKLEAGVTAQGETSLQTNNLQAVIDSMSANANIKVSVPNPILSKPLSVKAIITLTPDSFSAKNITLDLAGQKFASSVEVPSLKADVMQVNAMMTAEAPINLNTMLGIKPQVAVNQNQQNAENLKKENDKAALNAAAFLPETLQLGKDFDFSFVVSVPELSFNDTAASKVQLQLTNKAATISSRLSANALGGTIQDLSVLKFEKFEKVGSGVKYSQPVLTLNTQLKNIDVDDALLIALKPDQIKAFEPILSERLSTQLRGVVTPQKISIEPTNISLGQEELVLNFGYLRGARDKITLGIGTDGINADQWIKPKTKVGQEAAINSAVNSNKIDISKLAKSIAIPLDIDLTLALKNVKLQDELYDNIFFAGTLEGQNLRIERAGLTNSEKNNISISGTIGNVQELRDIDLTVYGTTPNAQKLAVSFNVDTKSWPKNVGRAELSSEFKGQADNLKFVANLKALDGAIESAGVITDLLNAPVVSDLTIRARHPSYVDMIRIFNPSFSSGVAIRKSFDVFTSMKRDNKTFKFSDIKADIGGVTMSGNIDYITGGSKPQILGALNFGAVPVDELLGMQRQQKGTVRATTTAPQNQTNNDVRWSRNAINTNWMWQADMDIGVTAKNMSYGLWSLDNAKTKLSLKDGDLKVSDLNGDFGGGKMKLALGMKSSQKERDPIAMNAQADFTNVQLEKLVSGFSGNKLIQAKGPVSMNLNVSSVGLSPAALVFALKGSGKAEGKQLTIDGIDIPRLARVIAAPSSSGTDNIKNIFQSTMSGGSTLFDTFYTDLQITEGVVTFPNFKLDNTQSEMKMTGDVNLPLWTVNLTNVISFKDAVDAPAMTMIFKGSLDNPGKTFGQNALENYIGGILGDKLQNKLDGKLNDALDGKLKDLLGGSGILPLGNTGKATEAPKTPDAKIPAVQVPDTKKPVSAPTSESAVTPAQTVSPSDSSANKTAPANNEPNQPPVPEPVKPAGTEGVEKTIQNGVAPLELNKTAPIPAENSEKVQSTSPQATTDAPSTVIIEELPSAINGAKQDEGAGEKIEGETFDDMLKEIAQ